MIIGYEAKRIFHNRSGLGNYGRNLLRALYQHYPDNQYYLYNYRPGPISFNPGASVREIQPSGQNKLLTTLWRQRLVSSRARRDGVQVFHGLSQELPYGLQKKGIRSIVTVHDLIFLRYPELYKRIDRSIYLKKLRHACQVANLIVAVSRQTRQDLIHFLGIAPHRIIVIYQGCDGAYWQEQTAERDALRATADLPENFALFVGSLEPRKRPVPLAQACAQLKIPLVLVGRSTRYWEDFWKKCPDEHKQYLYPLKVDSTPRLAALYQEARVFAYPSVFEGFGIPVLEALVSGTPVLTGKNSALTEAAGPSSRLIDVEDPDALRSALGELWEDEELRREMAATGRNFARQFSDENLASQWIQSYRSVLGE